MLHTIALQLAAHTLTAWVEGVALGVRGTTLEEIVTVLRQIARGAAPSGPLLARLAHNQLEEKYDWTLTPELRCIDYASRHLDEPGARDAASRILDSLRDAETEERLVR